MIERRGGGPIRNAGLVGALVAVVACGSSDQSDNASDVLAPRDYLLGGQTGSLVPGCGVAPLSAAGSSVPAGDALVVLYAKDCPAHGAAEELALLGQGSAGVTLELVPLGDSTSSVFLVRADQTLAGGDYQLALGTGSTSELRVSDETLAVPLSLGSLELLPSEGACPDQLRFQLTLQDAALAYAPLSRFDVSVDGGRQQLWVDYGALPIASSEQGNRGLLELPRCGSAGCLAGELHRLELTARVAGEVLQPQPLGLAFDVPCPQPEASPEPDAGCSLALSAAAPASGRLWPLLSCLSWFLLRRRR